jgi:hypothetical protein
LAAIPEKPPKARAASKLEAMPMSVSRSTGRLTRAEAAAFDFDVVTDTPPPRPRPPTAEPAAAGAETKPPARADPLEAKG